MGSIHLIRDNRLKQLQKKDNIILNLEKHAQRIRKHCVNMARSGKSAHVGSSLSCVEILTYLYFKELNVKAAQPDWHLRDRLIISKGHAAAVVYAALAECGFITIEELHTFYQNGTRLAGHVSHKVPGIEASTGSLGHGLSIAVGIALGSRINALTSRTYCLMSDGECNEGSTWEAIMFAGFHKLTNLVAIIDKNGMQAMGNTKEILDMDPMGKKWEAFGWQVKDIDGNSFAELDSAFSLFHDGLDKPLCIIAHTIKGKGVSFMENNILWHYRSPQNEEYELAIKELERKL